MKEKKLLVGLLDEAIEVLQATQKCYDAFGNPIKKIYIDTYPDGSLCQVDCQDEEFIENYYDNGGVWQYTHPANGLFYAYETLKEILRYQGMIKE